MEESDKQPQCKKRKVEKTSLTCKNQPKRQSRRITLKNKQKIHTKYLRSLRILQTTTSSRSRHFLHYQYSKTIRYCTNQYGFTANPNLTHWQNCKNKISQLPTSTYFNSITNLTFHNLCINHSPPPGTKHLLGLGHKFIPQRAFPKLVLQPIFTEFNRSIRLKYTFAGQQSNSLTKNDKKIYVKSDWVPDPGNDDLENRLDEFKKQLTKTAIENRTRLIRPTYNLDKSQYRTLHSLKNNPDIIVLLADKNLGPVTMDRETYIKRVINDHLLDEYTYEQLNEHTALSKLRELNDRLTHLFENPSAGIQNALTENEHHYFKKALHQEHRIPTFYGLVKIHKQPWTLRPVVSCCGSLLATISTWIDFHLQKLRTKLPAFIQDSTEFQRELNNTSIPKNTKIITCDAVSMYTNIDVEHSIETLRNWFIKFKSEIPQDIPTHLIITALDIVMKNNIFTFGDTFWLQKTGTAMGTPCACMVASIYFAYHERTIILNKYKDNLIFYKRFIDNVFCLWHENDEQLNTTETTRLKNFKRDMNNFGKLKWEFEKLTLTTTFLDLNVTLVEKPYTTPSNHYDIKFSTYQKPMNLYLYIPPHSAHPPGVIRSLIFSQIKKYWQQNTTTDDFVNITKAFFDRLINRGHNPTKLRHIFHQTAQHIDTKQINNILPIQTTTPTDTDNIYLKWRFHPTDITRKTIQTIYKSTCEQPTPQSENGFRNLPTKTGARMQISKLTIAFTRDKNIRDLLIPSRLRHFPKYKVSTYTNSKKGDNKNDNETTNEW